MTVSGHNQQPVNPDEKPLPKVRPELEITRQIYDGQPYWVYKDPLALRYYRFNREEHFIISQMAKGTTLGDLKQAHYDEFHGDYLTNGEVGQFISTLTAKNLLQNNHPDRDELFYRSSRKVKHKKFFSQLINVLFFRIPLYDPDKILGRILPYIRFFWTRMFFLFYLVLIAVAAGMVIQRWPDFVYMFKEQFFTLMNLPIMLVSFWLIKILHEFGHGFTCKNFGGEVHEIGFMVLVLAPFLYCNVTDSWTFQKKSHRIFTTAAGILTEVLLAAVAGIVWYLTEPPSFIHTFSFNIALLCSFSTILFNANPLMKFDGYYMVMDLMEVPNLRQRASRLMNYLFVRYFLGGQTSELPEEHKYKFVFPLYAVCAALYRWFLVISISYSVYKMFERVHLIVLGRLLVTVSIFSMLILPVFLGGKKMYAQRYSLGVSNTRIMTLLAIFVVLTGLGLFCPLPQHITLNFILEPAELTHLRCEVGGKLDWHAQTAEGNILKRGEVIASLTNKELLYQIESIGAQIEQAKIDEADFTARGMQDQSLKTAERLAMLDRQLKRLNEQKAALAITMPFDGEVLTSQQTLEQLEGAYVQVGSPLALVANSEKLTARVWVPEKMLARIPHKEGKLATTAELMLYAFSSKPFEGVIDSKAATMRELNMGEFNEKLALSNKVGGEILTEYDPVSGQERPMEAVYEVTIELDDEALPEGVKPYLSGRARIHCGDYTVFRWGMDSLRRIISPTIWL